MTPHAEDHLFAAILGVCALAPFAFMGMTALVIAGRDYRRRRDIRTRFYADCDDVRAQYRKQYRTGVRKADIVTDLHPAWVAMIEAEIWAEFSPRKFEADVLADIARIDVVA